MLSSVANPNETDNIGEIGVAAVNLVVRKELGWIFRQQPISDRGIDAEIEIQTPEGDATGRLLALQIKTGPSFLSDNHAGDARVVEIAPFSRRRKGRAR